MESARKASKKIETKTTHYAKHGFFTITKKDRMRLRQMFVILNVIFVFLLFLELFFPRNEFLRTMELAFGVLFVIELGYQYLFATQSRTKFFNTALILDILSIVSIFLRFSVEGNAFLHLLSAVRILRFYNTLDEFFLVYSALCRYRSLVVSLINLMVFIFVATTVVYGLEADTNPKIDTYVDALYFTVSTLTTTGFGDITPSGQGGRIISTVIMVIGVGMFLNIATSIFHPRKNYFKCRKCGLLYHDSDAAHCKHCGEAVQDETKKG